MPTKETTLQELAKEIAEKVANEFMKSILSRLTSEVMALRNDFSELRESMNKAWKAIEKLAEAQRRTEERLNELAEAQRRTEERLNELTKAVNSLVREVARLQGERIEDRIAMSLTSFFDKRGFDVFHHFPDIPYVDIIVETDGFLALIEVCKRCDLRDIRQVLVGAKTFEKKEGVKPDALVVFSYTGEIDEKALEEAKKRDIIVEWNIRRLVKKLLALAKEKKQ